MLGNPPFGEHCLHPRRESTQISAPKTFHPSRSVGKTSGGPPPVIVSIRDSSNFFQGPLILLFYHYYRVEDPPKKDLRCGHVHHRFQEDLVH